MTGSRKPRAKCHQRWERGRGGAVGCELTARLVCSQGCPGVAREGGGGAAQPRKVTPDREEQGEAGDQAALQMPSCLGDFVLGGNFQITYSGGSKMLV